jgi:hypothetical protein
LHELELAAREDVGRERPIQSSADRVAPEHGVVLSGAVREEEVWVTPFEVCWTMVAVVTL